MPRAILLTAAAGLILPLAACESGAPEADDKNIEVVDQGYAEKIAAMPDGSRNATFIRAIRDAGRECQHVQSSTSIGELSGSPAWTAVCDNGAEWTIVLGANGTATVLNTTERDAAMAAQKTQ